MIQKICLIQSPLDNPQRKLPYIMPPLGILSLATYLTERIPSLEIKVVDGDMTCMTELEKIMQIYSPEIVGISASALESYAGTLKIAKFAKGNGALVVLGGEQASCRAKQILANRPEIDYVVVGQGEIPLLSLVEGKNPDSIAGLAFRSETRDIISNCEGKRLSLWQNQLPLPDRSFVDIQGYSRIFQQGAESRFTGAKCYGSTRTQYGCLKAINYGPCIFCSRTDLLSMDFRKPETFWKEMQMLLELGIDYVWEVAPSFTAPSNKYLQDLAAAKPLDCHMRFRVYARADELCDEEKVDALARIGVENVLLGVESGSDVCLKLLNKHTTTAQNLQAAKNLRKYRLTLHAAFIVGSPGETAESISKTILHAHELKDEIGAENFRSISAGILQPYPGTIIFDECIKRFSELREQHEKDILDLDELTKRYVEKILKLDFGEAINAVEQIRGLAPIGTGKGPGKRSGYDPAEQYSYKTHQVGDA